MNPAREKLNKLLSKEKKLLGVTEKSVSIPQPVAKAATEIRPISKPQSSTVLSPDEADSSRRRMTRLTNSPARQTTRESTELQPVSASTFDASTQQTIREREKQLQLLGSPFFSPVRNRRRLLEGPLMEPPSPSSAVHPVRARSRSVPLHSLSPSPRKEQQRDSRSRRRRVTIAAETSSSFEVHEPPRQQSSRRQQQTSSPLLFSKDKGHQRQDLSQIEGWSPAQHEEIMDGLLSIGEAESLEQARLGSSAMEHTLRNPIGVQRLYYWRRSNAVYHSLDSPSKTIPAADMDEIIVRLVGLRRIYTIEATVDDNAAVGRLLRVCGVGEAMLLHETSRAVIIGRQQQQQQQQYRAAIIIALIIPPRSSNSSHSNHIIGQMVSPVLYSLFTALEQSLGRIEHHHRHEEVNILQTALTFEKERHTAVANLQISLGELESITGEAEEQAFQAAATAVSISPFTCGGLIAIDSSTATGRAQTTVTMAVESWSNGRHFKDNVDSHSQHARALKRLLADKSLNLSGSEHRVELSFFGQLLGCDLTNTAAAATGGIELFAHACSVSSQRQVWIVVVVMSNVSVVSSEHAHHLMQTVHTSLEQHQQQRREWSAKEEEKQSIAMIKAVYESYFSLTSLSSALSRSQGQPYSSSSAAAACLSGLVNGLQQSFIAREALAVRRVQLLFSDKLAASLQPSSCVNSSSSSRDVVQLGSWSGGSFQFSSTPPLTLADCGWLRDLFQGKLVMLNLSQRDQLQAVAGWDASMMNFVRFLAPEAANILMVPILTEHGFAVLTLFDHMVNNRFVSFDDSFVQQTGLLKLAESVTGLLAHTAAIATNELLIKQQQESLHDYHLQLIAREEAMELMIRKQRRQRLFLLWKATAQEAIIARRAQQSEAMQRLSLHLIDMAVSHPTVSGVNDYLHSHLSTLLSPYFPVGTSVECSLDARKVVDPHLMQGVVMIGDTPVFVQVSLSHHADDGRQQLIPLNESDRFQHMLDFCLDIITRFSSLIAKAQREAEARIQTYQTSAAHLMQTVIDLIIPPSHGNDPEVALTALCRSLEQYSGAGCVSCVLNAEFIPEAAGQQTITVSSRDSDRPPSTQHIIKQATSCFTYRQDTEAGIIDLNLLPVDRSEDQLMIRSGSSSEYECSFRFFRQSQQAFRFDATNDEFLAFILHALSKGLQQRREKSALTLRLDGLRHEYELLKSGIVMVKEELLRNEMTALTQSKELGQLHDVLSFARRLSRSQSIQELAAVVWEGLPTCLGCSSALLCIQDGNNEELSVIWPPSIDRQQADQLGFPRHISLSQLKQIPPFSSSNGHASSHAQSAVLFRLSSSDKMSIGGALLLFQSPSEEGHHQAAEAATDEAAVALLIGICEIVLRSCLFSSRNQDLSLTINTLQEQQLKLQETAAHAIQSEQALTRSEDNNQALKQQLSALQADIKESLQRSQQLAQQFSEQALQAQESKIQLEDEKLQISRAGSRTIAALQEEIREIQLGRLDLSKMIESFAVDERSVGPSSFLWLRDSLESKGISIIAVSATELMQNRLEHGGSGSGFLGELEGNNWSVLLESVRTGRSMALHPSSRATAAQQQQVYAVCVPRRKHDRLNRSDDCHNSALPACLLCYRIGYTQQPLSDQDLLLIEVTATVALRSAALPKPVEDHSKVEKELYDDLAQRLAIKENEVSMVITTANLCGNALANESLETTAQIGLWLEQTILRLFTSSSGNSDDNGGVVAMVVWTTTDFRRERQQQVLHNYSNLVDNMLRTRGMVRSIGIILVPLLTSSRRFAGLLAIEKKTQQTSSSSGDFSKAEESSIHLLSLFAGIALDRIQVLQQVVQGVEEASQAIAVVQAAKDEVQQQLTEEYIQRSRLETALHSTCQLFLQTGNSRSVRHLLEMLVNEVHGILSPADGLTVQLLIELPPSSSNDTNAILVEFSRVEAHHPASSKEDSHIHCLSLAIDGSTAIPNNLRREDLEMRCLLKNKAAVWHLDHDGQPGSEHSWLGRDQPNADLILVPLSFTINGGNAVRAVVVGLRNDQQWFQEREVALIQHMANACVFALAARDSSNLLSELADALTAAQDELSSLRPLPQMMQRLTLQVNELQSQTVDIAELLSFLEKQSKLHKAMLRAANSPSDAKRLALQSAGESDSSVTVVTARYLFGQSAVIVELSQAELTQTKQKSLLVFRLNAAHQIVIDDNDAQSVEPASRVTVRQAMVQFILTPPDAIVTATLEEYVIQIAPIDPMPRTLFLSRLQLLMTLLLIHRHHSAVTMKTAERLLDAKFALTEEKMKVAAELEAKSLQVREIESSFRSLLAVEQQQFEQVTRRRQEKKKAVAAIITAGSMFYHDLPHEDDSSSIDPLMIIPLLYDCCERADVSKYFHIELRHSSLLSDNDSSSRIALTVTGNDSAYLTAVIKEAGLVSTTASSSSVSIQALPTAIEAEGITISLKQQDCDNMLTIKLSSDSPLQQSKAVIAVLLQVLFMCSAHVSSVLTSRDRSNHSLYQAVMIRRKCIAGLVRFTALWMSLRRVHLQSAWSHLQLAVSNHHNQSKDDQLAVQSRRLESSANKIEQLERVTADWTQIAKSINGAAGSLSSGVRGLWERVCGSLVSLLTANCSLISCGLVLSPSSSLTDDKYDDEDERSRTVELFASSLTTPLVQRRSSSRTASERVRFADSDLVEEQVEFPGASLEQRSINSLDRKAQQLIRDLFRQPASLQQQRLFRLSVPEHGQTAAATVALFIPIKTSSVSNTLAVLRVVFRPVKDTASQSTAAVESTVTNFSSLFAPLLLSAQHIEREKTRSDQLEVIAAGRTTAAMEANQELQEMNDALVVMKGIVTELSTIDNTSTETNEEDASIVDSNKDRDMSSEQRAIHHLAQKIVDAIATVLHCDVSLLLEPDPDSSLGNSSGLKVNSHIYGTNPEQRQALFNEAGGNNSITTRISLPQPCKGELILTSSSRKRTMIDLISIPTGMMIVTILRPVGQIAGAMTCSSVAMRSLQEVEKLLNRERGRTLGLTDAVNALQTLRDLDHRWSNIAQEVAVATANSFSCTRSLLAGRCLRYSLSAGDPFFGSVLPLLRRFQQLHVGRVIAVQLAVCSSVNRDNASDENHALHLSDSSASTSNRELLWLSSQQSSTAVIAERSFIPTTNTGDSTSAVAMNMAHLCLMKGDSASIMLRDGRMDAEMSVLAIPVRAITEAVGVEATVPIGAIVLLYLPASLEDEAGALANNDVDSQGDNAEQEDRAAILRQRGHTLAELVGCLLTSAASAQQLAQHGLESESNKLSLATRLDQQSGHEQRLRVMAMQWKQALLMSTDLLSAGLALDQQQQTENELIKVLVKAANEVATSDYQQQDCEYMLRITPITNSSSKNAPRSPTRRSGGGEAVVIVEVTIPFDSHHNGINVAVIQQPNRNNPRQQQQALTQEQEQQCRTIVDSIATIIRSLLRSFLLRSEANREHHEEMQTLHRQLQQAGANHTQVEYDKAAIIARLQRLQDKLQVKQQLRVKDKQVMSQMIIGFAASISSLLSSSSSSASADTVDDSSAQYQSLLKNIAQSMQRHKLLSMLTQKTSKDNDEDEDDDGEEAGEQESKRTGNSITAAASTIRCHVSILDALPSSPSGSSSNSKRKINLQITSLALRSTTVSDIDDYNEDNIGSIRSSVETVVMSSGSSNPASAMQQAIKDSRPMTVVKAIHAGDLLGLPTLPVNSSWMITLQPLKKRLTSSKDDDGEAEGKCDESGEAGGADNKNPVLRLAIAINDSNNDTDAIKAKASMLQALSQSASLLFTHAAEKQRMTIKLRSALQQRTTEGDEATALLGLAQEQLSRWRRLHKTVFKEALQLLDPPASVSSEGSSKVAMPTHPAGLSPLAAARHCGLGLLRAAMTITRAEGAALLLREGELSPVSSNISPAPLRLLYLGDALGWPGVAAMTFGTVSLATHSLTAACLTARKCIVVEDGPGDRRYNSRVDGLASLGSPMMVVPLRGRAGGVLGVLLLARGGKVVRGGAAQEPSSSAFNAEDAAAAEMLSTMGSLHLFWAAGLGSVHRQLTKALDKMERLEKQVQHHATG